MKWEKVRLGQICKIKTGKYDVNHSVPDGKFPFFTCAIEPFASNTFSFDGELILLPGNGANVGEVMFYNGKAEAYQRTYVLQNFNAHPKFIYYAIKSRWKSNLKHKQYGSATNYIRLDNITDFELPLPPLSVQKQIADTLDKADALRQKGQQLLQKYDALTQSIFYDMFGDPFKNSKDWKIKSMKALIDSELQNGLYKPSSAYGIGTPILRIDSFYDGVVRDVRSLKRISISAKEIEKYKLQKDDIVINRVNSRSFLGKCGLIPELQEPTVFESNMMKFRVKEDIVNPFYLVRILSHDFVKQQVMNRCKDAVNQSSINQQDVLSFVVPIPPIELQNKYRVVVSEIELSRFKVLKGLKLSNQLFQNLISNFFK